MNLFWAFGLPAMVVVVVTAGVLWARGLQFFSSVARDLDRVDIPNEVGEIRINELEMLVGDEADWMFKNAWKITRWERRRAVSNRHRQVRKWLHLLISNAALFREIARFHIQEAISTKAEATGDQPDKSDLPFRVMDRAAMVQFMAAACLVKLRLLDFCRMVQPFYVPQLADHFQVRGHDLVTWYRHMGKEMLELTQHYYDDITYTRFIFQLTGLFNVEEASRLNRL